MMIYKPPYLYNKSEIITFFSKFKGPVSALIQCIGGWVCSKIDSMGDGSLSKFYWMGGGFGEKVPPDTPIYLILE